MVHKDGLEDLMVIEKGFQTEWNLQCCDEHSNFLLDFALPRLLSQPPDQIFQSKFTHLFQRTMFLLGCFNQPLSDPVVDDIISVLQALMAHRNDFLAHAGVDAFQKFLELHHKTCDKCVDSDCEQLRNVQNRMQGFEIKDKLAGRVTALNFIVADMLLNESNMNVHFELIKVVLADSDKLSVTNRLLAQIFKHKELTSWFVRNLDKLMECCACGPKIVVADALISYTTGNQYTWDQFVDLDTVRMAAVHSNDEVRCTTLKLLCRHPKASMPLRRTCLELAVDLLLTSMTVESPQIRDQMVESIKKVIQRIAIFVQSSAKNGKLTEVLPYLSEFVLKIHDACVECLDKSDNFNRRLTSFQLLEQIHSDILKENCNDSTVYDVLGLQTRVNNDYFFKIMIKSLDDSYEKCQRTAVVLLSKVNGAKKWSEFVEDAIQNSFNMSAHVQHTVRYRMRVIPRCCPTHTAPTLKRLSSEANRMTLPLKTNLSLISDVHPIHTLLNAISALLADAELNDVNVQALVETEVITMCFVVTELVNPVLHSISPEGIVLDEEDSDDDPEQVHEAVLSQKMQSQRLLLACWRTLKAVSEIFSTLVSRAPDAILQDQWRPHLPGIVAYFWSQLTECRHRGAFEMASECFGIVCLRLKHLFPSPASELNPETWLNNICDRLDSNDGIHRLCSTRRSAGMPLMVASILRAFQPVDRFAANTHLDRVVQRMLAAETNEVLEVHKVNVLKALFSNKAFRHQVQHHVELALEKCIQRLATNSWSVRNAYSQLFAAVALRIFGPQHINRVGTAMSAFEFFTTFPRLHPLFLHTLRAFRPQCTRSVECTNALLSLLNHIKPAPLQCDDRFDLRPLLLPIHRIAFTSISDHSRAFAIKALHALLLPNALARIALPTYMDLLANWETLKCHTLTSTVQLVHNLLCTVNDITVATNIAQSVVQAFSKNTNELKNLPQLTMHYVTILFIHVDKIVKIPDAIQKSLSLQQHSSASDSVLTVMKEIADLEQIEETINTDTEVNEKNWTRIDETVAKTPARALDLLGKSLQVDGMSNPTKNKALVRVAAFLQHESRTVRDQASAIIGAALLHSSQPLFPRIAWLLVRAKCPQIVAEAERYIPRLGDQHLVEQRRPQAEAQRVFDQCSQNTFSETQTFSFEADALHRLLLSIVVC